MALLPVGHHFRQPDYGAGMVSMRHQGWGGDACLILTLDAATAPGWAANDLLFCCPPCPALAAWANVLTPLEAFLLCLRGPGQILSHRCVTAFDTDGDHDIDLKDP